MMIPTVDIAARVYNHKWKIDPIVRSLIDTDFYKLLMCQSVFRNRPDTHVSFSLINRSRAIRLADLIDEGELREQLDHARGLTLTRGESTEDIFVHMETLRHFGIAELRPGQVVLVRYGRGQKGLMAAEIHPDIGTLPH